MSSAQRVKPVFADPAHSRGRNRFESGGDKAHPKKGPAPVYPGRGEFSKTSAKYPLPYLSPALTYRNSRDLSTPKSEIDIESEKCRGMKFVQV